jgi:integrase/recombinase XerD
LAQTDSVISLINGKESIMRYAINNQIVLSHPPEGPIASHIASFASAISKQGYCLRWLKYQVQVVAAFSRWLKQKHIELRSVCDDHVIRYLRYRSRHLQPRQSDAAALMRLLDLLRRDGLVPLEKKLPPRLTPVAQCVKAYEAYLRETRGLAECTIKNHVPFIHDFLGNRFGDGQVVLSRLCARDVVTFVQRQASCLHLKRTKRMTIALRSFLRYLRYRGDITLDLAAAVPVVANWSMTSIPRAIAADQVRELLVSIDQTTTIGRRNYAVLLLLARLGLRAGEVASLELDDIDWNWGQLRVHGKGGTLNELPLTKEVGKAIAAYLRSGRPSSTSRRVFLHAKAPIHGFRGASGIGGIVCRCLRRAGIHPPTMGAHQFRHGLATEMLRQGASLTEIGELLGHHHPQATMIYAKVDLNALRTLALPWPGGMR